MCSLATQPLRSVHQGPRNFSQPYSFHPTPVSFRDMGRLLLFSSSSFEVSHLMETLIMGRKYCQVIQRRCKQHKSPTSPYHIDTPEIPSQCLTRKILPTLGYPGSPGPSWLENKYFPSSSWRLGLVDFSKSALPLQNQNLYAAFSTWHQRFRFCILYRNSRVEMSQCPPVLGACMPFSLGRVKASRPP